MESLFNNKPLLYSLAFSGTAITALASGVVPDIADQFEIVPLPIEVTPVRQNLFSTFIHSQQLIISNVFNSLRIYFCEENFKAEDFVLFFQFRNTVLQILAADICGSFIIDRVCSFLFGRGSLRRV